MIDVVEGTFQGKNYSDVYMFLLFIIIIMDRVTKRSNESQLSTIGEMN